MLSFESRPCGPTHRVIASLRRCCFSEPLMTRSSSLSSLLFQRQAIIGSGSEIAQREGLHNSTVNELLRLTLLEPPTIQGILAGHQPRYMSLLWFQRNPLSTDWMAQREVGTAFDA